MHIVQTLSICQTQYHTSLYTVTMALPTYYTYQDPYPATLNDSNVVQLETRPNWPKLYSYNSSNYATQGIHPPAPVYNAQQQVGQSWYYSGQVSTMYICSQWHC